MKKQTGSRGFTLMELMLVIVLLGFLIAAAIGSYVSSLKKSRDSRRKNDLRQIAVSLETYNNDKGRYPLSSSDGNGLIMGCGDGTGVCNWGDSFKDTYNVYMGILPGDASSTQRFFYVSDGTYYQLYTRLENTLDSAIPKDAQNKARIFGDMNCATGNTTIYCNYGVSSSNKTVEYGHESRILYE